MKDDKKLDQILQALGALTMEVNGIKTDLADVKTDLAEHKEATATAFEYLYVYMNKEFAKRDERFDEIKDGINKLQITMDGLATDYTALREEEAASAALAKEVGDTLHDHETRLVKLEQASV